jgi:DNA-binding MarR family transcriptional regulator
MARRAAGRQGRGESKSAAGSPASRPAGPGERRRAPGPRRRGTVRGAKQEEQKRRSTVVLRLPFSHLLPTYAPALVSQRPTMQKPKAIPLDELSAELQLSKQTIVRWVDRHLIDADLYWTLNDENEEVRMIDITDQTFDFLESFAAEYREDVVSRTEARRILKQIDRKKIKKLIRAGDVEDVEVDDETRIVVGSLEDYLIAREQGADEEDE